MIYSSITYRWSVQQCKSAAAESPTGAIYFTVSSHLPLGIDNTSVNTCKTGSRQSTENESIKACTRVSSPKT